MRIAPWRLVLTAGAIIVLAVSGIGIVSAATSPTAPAAAAVTGGAPAGRDLPRLPRLGRHLVHAVITLDHPDDGLITIQLDHGTVASVGSGTLTIAEAGGTTVTVTTNDQTRVRRHGEKATLGDLETGDEVYVVSRVPSGGGQAVAKRVFAQAPKDD